MQGLALTLVARRAVSIWMHLHPAAVQWRCWSGAPISLLLHLRWGLVGAVALARDGIRCTDCFSSCWNLAF